MKITCPHCSQNLELDPETLAALQGQPHFACPSCAGLMAVPQAQPVASSPRQPVQSSTQPAPKKKSFSGLILAGIGVVAAIAAGLFFFLTSPAVQEREIEIAPGVKMTFVWCPPGSVLRQETNLFNESEVVGTVFSLTKGFWIGKYEVTQEQWASVMGNNPSEFKGRTLPVEMVDWNQANAYLTKVGKGFRLPTEAEWEYACRAGSLTEYCFGDEVAKLADYAWYGDPKGFTHPVGQKKSNDWGIHDMHGNVWEWCQDIKGEDYWDEGFKGSRTDPSGATSGGDRVNRGGCWKFDADASRSAKRGWVPQGGLNLSYLGFRVALSSIE